MKTQFAQNEPFADQPFSEYGLSRERIPSEKTQRVEYPGRFFTNDSRYLFTRHSFRRFYSYSIAYINKNGNCLAPAEMLRINMTRNGRVILAPRVSHLSNQDIGRKWAKGNAHEA